MLLANARPDKKTLILEKSDHSLFSGRYSFACTDEAKSAAIKQMAMYLKVVFIFLNIYDQFIWCTGISISMMKAGYSGHLVTTINSIKAPPN